MASGDKHDGIGASNSRRSGPQKSPKPMGHFKTLCIYAAFPLMFGWVYPALGLVFLGAVLEYLE
jgi:hypothetical protein